MRNKSFFCIILCLAITANAMTGASVCAASDSVGNTQQELSPEENDPGFERLSGIYEPAAEENISNGAEEPDGNSSDSSITSPALRNLKKLSSSASAYTGQTYTHASNFDGMNIYNGIDVSYHQGTINWNKVKNDGIDYSIIRLGYRGYSNGTLVTDSKFDTYMQEAIAAGIPVGVYFWTEAVNVDEAIAEAQYVINKLAPYKDSVTMPVAFDWELNSNSRHSNLSQSTNTAICTAFCDIIAGSGYTPVIYANIHDLNNNMDGVGLSQKYDIWVARYNNIVNNSTAQFSGDYCMWQYSSSGSVDGISGNVDMDFWYTTSTPSSPAFRHGATPSAISTPEPDKDIDELDDVNNLSAKSASKSITLSWSKVKNADGYQIYRKDTYDGTFKKIATVTDADAAGWKNTGLSKKHEYYYKVRAYHKNSDGNIYSDYSNITAATKSSYQAGLVKKPLILYKKPAANAKKLMTAPKGTPLEYVGITYLKNGSSFHHYRYYTLSKTYDAYRTAKSSVTYYAHGTTTAKLNLRQKAGTSGKLLTSIPKNSAIPLLGSKKVNGVTWYKTCFATKKKVTITGYVAGSYIKRN